MRDLRVLFISTYHPLEGCAASIHLRNLSKQLANLGCEVHILTHNKKIGEVLDGVQIHAFKTPVPMDFSGGMFFSLFSARKTEELCREYRIDIVHGQSPSSVGYAFLHRNKLPYIVTVHSTPFGGISVFLKMPLSAFSSSTIYRGLISHCISAVSVGLECRKADRVVAVSKSLAEEVANFYNLPKDKVVAIHNGVNLPVDLPTKVHDGRRVILFVGRLAHEKGLKYLVAAMPQVLKRFPDVRLQMAGYGNYREYLENLAKELNVNGSIDFLGGVPPDKLFPVYDAASVIVQPSIYEAFGLPVLEAMSIGKPVVGTRTGGIPELIKNGENGLLVEPGNTDQLAKAILSVLSDASYAKKLGERGRNMVIKHFTWEETGKKTLELYEEALENSAGRQTQ